MIKQLSDMLDFQAQALTLRSERQRLLASNIANAETPGYRALDMDFAQALNEATGGGHRLATPHRSGSTTRSGTSASTPAPGHIPLRNGLAAMDDAIGAARAGGAASTYQFAQSLQNSADHNTVDMDRQRAAFADNSIRYEAALRFINGGVRTMLEAIKGQSS